MESSEISYLLSLPDEILIYKIFPQYDVSYLLYLCQINKRFSIICQNDDLWHILTDRDFGNIPIPQGLNSWQSVYMFYNHLFTHPIEAIPYVEEALLQKRDGVNINLFQQKLLDKYKKDIIPISYMQNNGVSVSFTIHMLGLYDPITNILIPAKSLDQIKILHSNENMWEYLNPAEKENIFFFAKNHFPNFFDPSFFIIEEEDEDED